MTDTKKFAIASHERGRHRQVAAVPIKPTITADTKLVTTKRASEILLEQKGMELSPYSIRQRCANAVWAKGVFWVKPAQQYLINVQAIFEAIARGDSI